MFSLTHTISLSIWDMINGKAGWMLSFKVNRALMKEALPKNGSFCWAKEYSTPSLLYSYSQVVAQLTIPTRNQRSTPSINNILSLLEGYLVKPYMNNSYSIATLLRHSIRLFWGYRWPFKMLRIMIMKFIRTWNGVLITQLKVLDLYSQKLLSISAKMKILT